MSDYYPAVTDDYSADIVLQEIKEARAERDRLIELCQIKKAELDAKIEGLKAKCGHCGRQRYGQLYRKTPK